MWQLLRCSSSIQSTLKYSVLFKSSVFKTSNFIGIRRTFTKETVRKTCRQSNYTFSTVVNIGATLSITTLYKICSGSKVLCKKHTRLAGYATNNDKNLKFDWKKVWKYIEPHVFYLIAAILGALTVAILNIQIPQVMGGIINVITRFSDGHDSQHFLAEMKEPAFKLLSMFVAQSICTFFYISMLSQLGEKIAYDLRVDLFNNIMRQDMAFFDSQRTGEIVNRLTSDVQEFKSSFKQTVSAGLRAITQMIGCSIAMIVISPQMTFITLLCIPAVIGVGSVIGSSLRETSKKAQAQFEKATIVAEEAISNIRTVRAFAMEEQEMILFKHECEQVMILNEHLGYGIGIFQAGTNMFLNSMVLATLYMGGYLLSANQLSTGQLMAYLLASQTIQRSLAQISLLFGTVVRGTTSAARVFQYLDMKPTMNINGGHTISNEDLKGEVKFENVFFSYPSRPQYPVLSNFNLTLKAGKSVAIVGASGNGKSTVTVLLERFYDIDKGAITIDGCNISTLDPFWLRQNVIGYISQEPILFATTILENIRYGKPSATDCEVREAAKLADAHEFICKFPNDYNTIVGERGSSLSGGQKQRIAIARALLKNPKILILDEATSALDTESEHSVQAALEKCTEGRTVLIIAHRLSTVQNADLIVVLNKGKIVEMGTHEELKKKQGLYWSMNFQQHQQNDPPPRSPTP